jgi:outer membrane protein assembly factor BamB
LTVTAPPRQSSALPWPTYGAGNARVRAVAAPHLRPPFRMLWTFHGKALLEFPPVVGYGSLFEEAFDGRLFAIDPATGKVRWRTDLPRPANGGTLATAGGLVLLGDDDGFLYALDDRSGKVLWRHDLRRRVGSAPIAYEIDGVEYIAIAAGGSLVEARGTAPDRPGRLFVFRLGD